MQSMHDPPDSADSRSIARRNPLDSRLLRGAAVALAAAFCLVSVVYRTGIWRRAIAAPHLVALAPRFDFGAQPPTAVIDHVFELVNQGGKGLKVLDAEADCLCVIPDVRNRTLGPGEVLRLPIKIDFRGHKAGPVVAKILVRTDDPAHPRLVLVVEGRVAEN